MNLPWLKAHQHDFNDSLMRSRLGHAPLIHGPAGLGKRRLARWLVARILCLEPTDSQPCGRCRSCQLLQGQTHPDRFIAAIPEDKTQVTVDVIRELSRGLQLTPAVGPSRVGLLEEADRMNQNAANALLKTLEEPAPSAWLVLVSDRPEVLPATILSRCQKVAVHPPQTEHGLDWLRAEMPQAESERLALALEVAGGAPLRAKELITSKTLDFGLEIRAALLDAARHKRIPPGLIEPWAERAEEAWHWLAYWVRQWTGSSLGLGEDEPAAMDTRGLTELWQQALRGRGLADGSIRADLLLGKWLLEWIAVVDRKG